MSTPTPVEPIVRIDRDETVACITLARPDALNALDLSTARALRDACAEVTADARVRAIVLRGEGRSFGVGGDLAALRHDPVTTAHALIEPMHQAVRALAAADAPVLVSLQGAVAGGSLSLALGCDFAVMADDARLNLAYVNVAASCDVGGSWILPRLVGLRKALEIALLSETIDAHEALRLGLVNRVVAADCLQEETMALARRLANGATCAMGRMKRLMRQSFDNDFASQLDAERREFAASAATRDFAEAMDAFFARRAPVFHGN
jgi:2-(1,2-epoxy-1,2-dihydrophenyl)acetyl-CoA isomerase